MTLGTIDRTMIYRSDDGERIEHARLRISESGGVADGTVIGLYGRRPLRLRYEVTCDSRWHARNVSVEAIAIGRDLLSMSADEDGIWRRVDGGTFDEPVFHCADVDVALTPVTNALTIRRLGLEAGQAAIVKVAAVDSVTLGVRMVEHRYTALEVGADESRYRFENFDTGERAIVRIDPDGVIAAYDGAFTRIWPA